MSSPIIPPVPQPPQQQPDWKQLLPVLLGQASGLTGNRGFAKRWSELQKQKQEQDQLNQQMALQRQSAQIQQNAEARAAQQQKLTALNSLRQLLDVNQVADMDEYNQREQFATQLAPTLGIDPGYVQSLRPSPTRFDVIEAKKKLAEIEKTYTPTELETLATQPHAFELKSGKRMSLNELRQVAGTQPIDPMTGLPVNVAKPPKVDVPNTPEEIFYQRFAEEHNAPSFGKLPTALQAQARKQWMQADDRAQGGQRAPTQYQGFLISEKLAGDWANAQKPIKEMQRQLSVMDSGIQRYRAGDRNGGSQAVLVTFQKILDPTSVVRESEYARTADGQSLINRLQGRVDRAIRGGVTLSDAELQELVTTARTMLAGMTTFNQGLRRRIEAQASEFGIPTNRIIEELGTPAAPDAAPVGGTSTRVTAPGANPFRKTNAR